jgi:glycosyltransferase involved in cell wall biosynthesis
MRAPTEAPPAATVVHVVTSLELGGAQRMLAKLVTASLTPPERTHVVSLLPAGALAAPIEAAGATVHSLGLGHGSVAPLGLLALGRLLRRLRPDLVQGWMYHGNLAASLAARLGDSTVPVLWNIRGALDAPAAESRLTRLVIRVGAKLSAQAAAIVYNAEAAARQHAAAGYAATRSVVIGNGFDLDTYRPDPVSRPALRRRLGIAGDRLLVGIAAEVRPMKDHATLLAAFGRLAADGHDLDLVMLGTGATPDNAELGARIAEHGLEGRVHLLGPLADPAAVIKGLDLAVLSSAWGEGFPNFIGEAMAAGVPCVATDSGDCRPIIGETGRVVPPRDAAALAAALAAMAALAPDERRARGLAARARIVARYGLPVVVDDYRRLYRRCIAERNGGDVPAASSPARAA